MPNKIWKPKPVRYKVPPFADYSFRYKGEIYSGGDEITLDPVSERGTTNAIEVLKQDYKPITISIPVVPTSEKPKLVRKQKLDNLKWVESPSLSDLKRLEGAVNSNDWKTAMDTNLQQSASKVESKEAKERYRYVKEKIDEHEKGRKEAEEALEEARSKVNTTDYIISALEGFGKAKFFGLEITEEDKANVKGTLEKVIKNDVKIIVDGERKRARGEHGVNPQPYFDKANKIRNLIGPLSKELSVWFWKAFNEALEAERQRR